MAHDHRTGEGIGGWLGVFCVFAVAATAARTAWTLLALHGDPTLPMLLEDRLAAVQALEWTLALASILGCAYLLWRLTMRPVHGTVRIAVAAIWILGLALPLAEAIAVVVIADRPMSIGGWGDLDLPLSLAGCALWTGYFRRSKRVAATYRREDEPADLGEVFG
jgi:hypothetical protein